ncbi:hypothetical protein [Planktotalea sp.]|uniref:hypothetical protein n=1 Tax=Planktotalea sp. TaxID=2029877 RepID=UPI0025D379B0|nr:hypothetical protein [Planktotalea sp.]
MMRKDLNGIEELLSIGSFTESLSDLSQEEIAARLSVLQGDVSLGLACVSLREKIMDEVDVETAPKREYHIIVPKLKRGPKPNKKNLPRPLTIKSKRAVYPWI